jgi:hypothetical protein
MKPITLHRAVLAATVATAALAGVALPTAAQAQAVLSVQVGPPPARAEMVPPPRPGWVWSPGHHEWRHGQYVWMRGHWVRERPGYAYVAPAWVASGNGWAYQPPRWDARPVYRPGPRRDRDHDGVPNRYDRRPNDPRRY